MSDIYDLGVTQERDRITVMLERKIKQMRFDRLGSNGLRIQELNNNVIVLEAILEEVKVTDD